jgi:hypothetical protein
MARGDAYQLQGQDGGITLTGTDSWSSADGRTVRWIQFVEDTVLTSISSNIVDADTKLVSKTFTAGSGLGGETTAVTLTSGTAVLYYREG